jgi:membrane protein YdbS with pleckstrin-like domain
MTFTNDAVTAEQIPRYEVIEMTPLPDEALWVALISELLFLLVALVITVIGRYLNIPLFTELVGYWIAAVLLFMAMMMLWSRLSHKYRGYAIREHDIIYQRGVIWRTRTVLPFNRVQHVETQQGMLQRRFDLTTLNVFTAGGMRADLSISGMDVKVTDGVKTLLLKKIQDEQFIDD